MTPLLITLITAHYAAIAAGPSPHECALLALTGIAEAEDLRLGPGHWRLARIVGEQAATCERAQQLVAIARQETAWDSSAVSSAGACGITQVRSCDAEGTVQGLECCDSYEDRGYHCRPRCEWLLETANAISWTSSWLDDFGWSPRHYVGSTNPEVYGTYTASSDEHLRNARRRN